MHSGLNHWSLVAVISHWGRVQRLLGAASERFAVWLVTDEPVHAVASRLKEPGHNEGKVAMSTARAASCTEARGVYGICLGRNDGMRRSGMRGRNYTPFAVASSGHNKTSSPGELLIASRRAASLSHVCSKISVRGQREAKTNI
jgi:hypothetical protein